ncbi:hypothetical protein GCM10023083_20010 [Streptomyces phyllanthi]
MTDLTDLTDPPPIPTIDVHAHLLLPEVEEAVAGQPGLAEARDLDKSDRSHVVL